MTRTLLAAALFTCLPALAGAQAPDPRVENLLRQMTLEEKVGEMTQIDISIVTRVNGTATTPQQIDSAKLEQLLVKRNVGSLLNVSYVALTPAQWVDLTSMVQRFAARRRLPIPVIYGIDAVHGHQYMRGATIFPQNINMAATWNRDLVRRENQITAYETRASGIAWNFSPVLDVARQPLWSRMNETFGEDPFLVATMGSIAVAAEQRDPQPAIDSLLGAGNVTQASSPPRQSDVYVATTGKHFLGYSMPLSGKDRTAAWIPDRQLREYFLPSFKAAIDSGIRSIMVNSGEINGVPVHASHELLTDLLRTELGFRGVVVSDYEDILRLSTVHHVARTRRDAVRMAVNAGIDMSMVPLSTNFIDDVIGLVHAGEISEARIDEAVRRILRLKFEVGLFANASADPAKLANVASPAFTAVSRKAAEESITLLKNERDLLPLATGTRILVTGPGATAVLAMHGGWTYTWQGTDSSMYPRNIVTFLDALRGKFGSASVTHVAGAGLTTDGNIDAAVAAARSADVIVVALAEPPSAEKPGDIDDLSMPAAQLRLALAMEQTGKPVVLTVFEGRPRTIHDIVGGARAVLQAFLPGPYGGEALASVIAGATNPSGRLPYSYPRNAGDVEHYDRTASGDASSSKPDNGYRPEWDFGAGLSYTTFAYDSIALAKKTLAVGDTIVTSVTITNTGKRAGMEVVQVYSRQFYASVSPPIRRLRDFDKITLSPGERRTVTFRIPVQRLAFVGRDNRLGVEPGEFELQIGGKTARFIVE